MGIAKGKLLSPQLKIESTIGTLDTTLSEFLYLTEKPTLDVVDAQTLKHHAEDMIGAGQKALDTLKKRFLVE